MSRQDGYKDTPPPRLQRYLVASMDTDLDTPSRSDPPSPPPLRLADIPKHTPEGIDARDGDDYGEANGALKTKPDYDAAPQTPYYDYACKRSFVLVW